MSLPRCARLIRAQGEGAPAVDMLRSVPQPAYLAVLRKVRAAFDGPGANAGSELARALSGFPPIARAAPQWARDKCASDESGRALQNFAFAMEALNEKVRSAAPQRRILVRKMQLWYVGLGLEMRKTPASFRKETDTSAGNRLQPPQTGPWPSNCRAPAASCAQGLIARSVRSANTCALPPAAARASVGC